VLEKIIMGLATKKLKGKNRGTGSRPLTEIYMEEREKIAKNIGKKLKSRFMKKK
tara:strand:+ start:300 stop:461 length:162 start_codon:yes stop_codon:yes gene_type:complete